MRDSRVRRRWAEGRPVLATVAQFTDPASAELIGLMGFDCLWIDLEHQSLSVDHATNIIRAARVGDMDVMARPAKGEFTRMVRLLEAGATLIMYPRCESAEEAREIVRCAKFPPLGARGFFSSSPDNPYGITPAKDYLRQANQQTILVAQIESSVVQEGLRETCCAALAAGKRFGTIVSNVEYARKMLDVGATLLCYGSDLEFVHQGLIETRMAFAPLGFQFESKWSHEFQNRVALSVEQGQ